MHGLGAFHYICSGIGHCEKLLVLLRVGVRWMLKMYSFTYRTVWNSV